MSVSLRRTSHEDRILGYWFYSYHVQYILLDTFGATGTIVQTLTCYDRPQGFPVGSRPAGMVMRTRSSGSARRTSGRKGGKCSRGARALCDFHVSKPVVHHISEEDNGVGVHALRNAPRLAELDADEDA